MKDYASYRIVHGWILRHSLRPVEGSLGGFVKGGMDLEQGIRRACNMNSDWVVNSRPRTGICPRHREPGRNQNFVGKGLK